MQMSNLFSQLAKSNNQMAMIQNLINLNPQYKKAWETAQQLAKNPNKEQVIEQLAKEKGMTVEQVKDFAKQNGINI